MGSTRSKLSSSPSPSSTSPPASVSTIDTTPANDSPTNDHYYHQKQLLRRGVSLDQVPADAAQLNGILYDETTFVKFLTDVFGQEVELNESMQTLFRGNCVASKIMSHCFRTFGAQYLKQLLQPHIPTPTIATATTTTQLPSSSTTTTTATATTMNNNTTTAATTTTTKITTMTTTTTMPTTTTTTTTGDISYEIDSTKLEENGDIVTNQANLLKLTELILNSILSSGNNFPPQLHLMCTCLRRVLCKKYPKRETYLKAVGTVIFLRFINPAIVSPYESGIVDKQPPVRVTRGLMLVSKILQNIANNVEFSKEEHMLPFNDFVRANFEPLRQWVALISE